ncbi:hypothetical protein [Natrinema sp. 1APR25-10V2]|uniref:hypothetical protein n=1 Tax=Natrinema sp. 1APR25-10V2 TaxID=2951081 RepID=UPI00287B9A3F|nr:hypothetical protein [Natrinema sp. 1APR25-10V2]
MLTGLSWSAHKVKSLEPAWAFYEEMLELPVSERGDDELVAAADETNLVLLRTSGLPCEASRFHSWSSATKVRQSLFH